MPYSIDEDNEKENDEDLVHDCANKQMINQETDPVAELFKVVQINKKLQLSY